MLRIWLHGFRRYHDRTFEFESGKIHLIDGPTGCGKSTIFQAITWCLYGTYDGTSHHEKPKDKMWVQMEFNGCIIYRQRNPVLLRLQQNNNQILEGPVAQSQINNLFGPISLWNSASYIEQKGNNYLLSAPAQAKMDLLNILAYSGTDPKIVINNIVSKIKEIENQLSINQQSYNYDVQNFNNMKAKYNLDNSHYRTDHDIEIMEINMRDTTIKIESSKNELVKLKMMEAQRSSLLNQELSIKNSISAIPIVDPASIEERTLLQSKYIESQNLLLRVKECEREYSSLSTVQEPEKKDGVVPKYKHQELMDLMSENAKYDSNSRLASKHGIPYDKKIIDNEIENIDNTLSHQGKFMFNDALNSMLSRIPKIDLVPEYTEDHLRQLHVRKDEMLRSKTVLECPCCKAHLKHIGDRLETANESLFDTNEYNKVLSEIDNVAKYINLMREKTNAENQLNIFLKTNGVSEAKPIQISENIIRLHPNQIPMYQQKLNDLRNILYLQPVNLIYPRQCIDWWEYKDKKDNLEDKLNLARMRYNEYGMYDPVDIAKLESDKASIVRIDTLRNQLSGIQYQLSQIPPVMDTIVEINKTIDELSNNLSNTKSIYDTAKIASLIVEQHKQLTERYMNIASLHTRLTRLNNLKQRAINKECRDLTDVVDDINRFIEKHSHKIFEDPITIELSLYKTIKSTGLDKPQVNLHVLYRGGDLTTLKSLSGGEEERVNLLLTLALHEINSKILILDESLVSVDSDTKLACNNLIREVVGDEGIVLLVSHETCDGLYDKVTKIEYYND